MAIVDAPALSLRASGTLGAINYSLFRGQAVARAAYHPVQPNNPNQLPYQDNYAAIVQAWGQSLTPENRAAWADFADNLTWVNRLGNSWKPSGFLVFCKMNMIKLARVAGIMADPPVNIPAVYPSHFEVRSGVLPGEVVVLLDGYPAGAEPDYIQVWAAGPYDSGGRHARRNEFRLEGYWGTPFKASIPGFTIGKWYWFSARTHQDIGVHGCWFEDQIKVV